MLYPLLSIALGAVFGAWLRWWVGLKLNPLFMNIPLGTVLVNLLGGFIIGFAVAYFSSSQLNPNVKLLVITGFCGALTTFSTFSIEMVELIQHGKWGYAFLLMSIHVIGSVLCTILGLLCYQWISAS